MALAHQDLGDLLQLLSLFWLKAIVNEFQLQIRENFNIIIYFSNIIISASWQREDFTDFKPQSCWQLFIKKIKSPHKHHASSMTCCMSHLRSLLGVLTRLGEPRHKFHSGLCTSNIQIYIPIIVSLIILLLHTSWHQSIFSNSFNLFSTASHFYMLCALTSWSWFSLIKRGCLVSTPWVFPRMATLLGGQPCEKYRLELHFPWPKTSMLNQNFGKGWF